MSCAVSRGDFPPYRRERYWPRLDLRRLTPEQVARIRTPGANLSALAREFGVSPVAALKIWQRKTYRDLP